MMLEERNVREIRRKEKPNSERYVMKEEQNGEGRKKRIAMEITIALFQYWKTEKNK